MACMMPNGHAPIMACMRDKDASLHARVPAAEIILERAYGAADQNRELRGCRSTWVASSPGETNGQKTSQTGVVTASY
jgi:hypothetical protein